MYTTPAAIRAYTTYWAVHRYRYRKRPSKKMLQQNTLYVELRNSGGPGAMTTMTAATTKHKKQWKTVLVGERS